MSGRICWDCGALLVRDWCPRCKRARNDRDTYGEKVTARRVRMRPCRHKVPCLTFRCSAAHHKGLRGTPWCAGHDTDEIDKRGEWCDGCWYVRFMAQERRALAR